MKRALAIAVGSLLLAAVAAISFLALAGLRKSRDAVDGRDSAAARIDTLFAEWNRSDSPGCSVGVSRNAVPVLERGYGMANLDLRAPITPASVFRPGEGDSIELTAVSPTRFIVAGTPIEVEFVPAAGGRPQQMRVVGAAAKPAVMDQVVVTFAPSATDLREFVGSYRNDELGVTYTLVARETGLELQMPGRPDVPLKPFVPDKFYGSLVEVVTFSRDARGVVTGFSVHTTGVRNLRFDRLKGSPSASINDGARPSGPPRHERDASGRDVPRPLPGAERALTCEERKFLALQLEQDPDLLMKGLVGLLAVPLPLAREEQRNAV